MIANHLTDALAQVRQVQSAVLERQRFRGYSGRARALSGWLALAASSLMQSEVYPTGNPAIAIGWGGVFLLAFFMNAAALLHWFMNDPRVDKNFHRLKPMLDTIAPIAVGGILTSAFLLYGFHDYLYGLWMCMFGLTNLASRQVLPRAIALVGIFYIFCGSVYLLLPNPSLLNPWPMGLVFFTGELTGGLILHFDHRRYLAQSRFQRMMENLNLAE